MYITRCTQSRAKTPVTNVRVAPPLNALKACYLSALYLYLLIHLYYYIKFDTEYNYNIRRKKEIFYFPIRKEHINRNAFNKNDFYLNFTIIYVSNLLQFFFERP